MEKLTASLLAALSASLVYLLLRRRAEAPTALLLTLAYAFGTTTWVISSQAPTFGARYFAFPCPVGLPNLP